MECPPSGENHCRVAFLFLSSCTFIHVSSHCGGHPLGKHVAQPLKAGVPGSSVPSLPRLWEAGGRKRQTCVWGGGGWGASEPQLYSQDHVGCAEDWGTAAGSSEAVLWCLSLDTLRPVMSDCSTGCLLLTKQIPSSPENTKAARCCQTGCGSCFSFGGLPQRLHTLYGRWSYRCTMERTLGLPPVPVMR